MMNRYMVTIRDMLNLALFFVTMLSVVYYTYTVTPELINLKNAIFPMSEAILLCILLAIIFVFLNRLTSYFAYRLMKNR